MILLFFISQNSNLVTCELTLPANRNTPGCIKLWSSMKVSILYLNEVLYMVGAIQLSKIMCCLGLYGFYWLGWKSPASRYPLNSFCFSSKIDACHKINTVASHHKKRNLWIYIDHPFRTWPLYPLWLWFNAGTPGHVCLSHSSWVPPRRARHLGTVQTGNFPQVDGGKGKNLPPSLHTLISHKHTDTHTLYLLSHKLTNTPTYIANSDIKPGPDVAILSPYRTIWPQAVYCIHERQCMVII